MKRAEPLRGGGVVIQEMDLNTVSHDDIVAWNTYDNIMSAEARPEDPPTPVEVTRAGVRNIPDFLVPRIFIARDPDGSIAANAQAVVTRAPTNRHMCQVTFGVRLDRRRRGIARELLRLVVEAAEAENRTLLVGRSSERVPAGEEFARRVGAEPAQQVLLNRLVLSELEKDKVRAWIEQGPVRARDYRLIAVDGAYPEEMIEAIVDLALVMNTAPRDGLRIEDGMITVDQMRTIERSALAQGTQRWSLFARYEPTGELVGFTEVAYDPASLRIVQQLGTAVRPSHRGHALGKWLKAVMLERIVRERPEVEEVRTGNAASNDAMIGINRELKFKPHIAATAWQVTVARVREYLAETSVPSA